MLAGSALVLTFLALSGLHWYWVIAGTGHLKGFVPEIDGKPAFEPGRSATAAVALGLLVAAGVCATQAQLWGLPQLPISRIGVWFLLVAFALRALGELKLVGFFKRVRDTEFGRRDTLYYSPLCLLISALCGALLHFT